MSRFSVDSSRLRAKLRATQFAAEHAAGAAIEELGSFLVDTLEVLSPRDTNRYVRGWIDAGRKAGVTDRPLPSVVASRNQDQYLEKLEKQVEYWQDRVAYARGRIEQYQRWDAEAPPRKDGKPRSKRTAQPYYAKMVRVEQSSLKRLKRATEELAKARGSDGFVFFDVEGIAQRKQGRKLSTVREKVYGGEGRVIRGGTMAVVELRNKEPHARIVERHPHLGHPVATAKQIVAAAGARPVSNAYKKELLARSPMAA